MQDDKPNGAGTQQVTLRIFIDCDTVAQVGAIMSTCEQIGVVPKLVPHTLRGVVAAGKRRSRFGLLAVGDTTRAGVKYVKHYKRVQELLKQSETGSMQRIDLVSALAKSFRLENKMAGYIVKGFIDNGALKDA